MVHSIELSSNQQCGCRLRPPENLPLYEVKKYAKTELDLSQSCLEFFFLRKNVYWLYEAMSETLNYQDTRIQNIMSTQCTYKGLQKRKYLKATICVCKSHRKTIFQHGTHSLILNAVNLRRALCVRVRIDTPKSRFLFTKCRQQAVWCSIQKEVKTLLFCNIEIRMTHQTAYRLNAIALLFFQGI